MKPLKNAIHLIGYLCTNPIIKKTLTGKKLATFNLSTSNNGLAKNGENIIETQWHKLIAIGKIAEMVEQSLSNGTQIAISGKLINRFFKDESGNKRFETEIFAQEIFLLNHKAIA